ncbi:CLUMA_CG006012, isoform A [Clunio marinus]|uniref:CLUMA_CG006012, isoform A n=1 Tax=Clunio marinus TaxID=568069 RepID=A0A1J1HWQ3_9DIPT|nr:CLUMA_CG006012, isoform A [Clunio marinus]
MLQWNFHKPMAQGVTDYREIHKRTNIKVKAYEVLRYIQYNTGYCMESCLRRTKSFELSKLSKRLP